MLQWSFSKWRIKHVFNHDFFDGTGPVAHALLWLVGLASVVCCLTRALFQ